MEKFISNLPIEIRYRIICFLDIESRISLGVITKMKLPPFIKNIENKIQKPDNYFNLQLNKKKSIIKLGTLYVLNQDINNNIVVVYSVEHYKDKHVYKSFIFGLSLLLPDIYMSCDYLGISRYEIEYKYSL